MTDIIMGWAFDRLNAWTFNIPEVKKLLDRYDVGKGWADPFSGKSTLCEYRNDMNPERNQPSQLEAVDFCNQLVASGVKLDGVVLDPPYSNRQVTEHYKSMGMKATAMDTSANFIGRVKTAIAPAIKVGGVGITFGWNSNGFYKNLGFEKREILLIAHGLTHYDTIVVCSEKVREVPAPTLMCEE